MAKSSDPGCQEPDDGGETPKPGQTQKPITYNWVVGHLPRRYLPPKTEEAIIDTPLTWESIHEAARLTLDILADAGIEQTVLKIPGHPDGGKNIAFVTNENDKNPALFGFVPPVQTHRFESRDYLSPAQQRARLAAGEPEPEVQTWALDQNGRGHGCFYVSYGYDSLAALLFMTIMVGKGGLDVRAGDRAYYGVLKACFREPRELQAYTWSAAWSETTRLKQAIAKHWFLEGQAARVALTSDLTTGTYAW